jgi:hypothetical protein
VYSAQTGSGPYTDSYQVGPGWLFPHRIERPKREAYSSGVASAEVMTGTMPLLSKPFSWRCLDRRRDVPYRQVAAVLCARVE